LNCQGRSALPSSSPSAETRSLADAGGEPADAQALTENRAPPPPEWKSEQPKLAVAHIAVERTYAIGFPAYAAVTIAANMPNAWVDAPWMTWRSSYGMAGIALMKPGSTNIVYRHEPREVRDEVPIRRLGLGERRRMLLDLTEVLPEHIAPGAYDAVMSVGWESIRGTSAPVRIVFRRPTERERAELAPVAGEVRQEGTWGQWMQVPPDEKSPLHRAWGPGDPLRFNWIMRELYYGKAELSEIPLARLDVLDGLFVPEREALRAELMAARHDAALTVQIERVRRDYPDLAWWIDDLVAGRSDLAWSRKK